MANAAASHNGASPNPSAVKKAHDTPVHMPASDLRPGDVVVYDTPQGWKIDEKVLSHYPAGACFGSHYRCGDKFPGAIKCWGPGAMVYVRRH